MAADRIEIRGVRAMAVIGVCTHEREIAQPFQLDLDLHVDLRAAGVSDDLDDTVDYGAVTTAAARVVTEANDLLLERVAHRVVDAVLALDPRIEAVEIVLTKLNPPLPIDVGSTAVRLVRGRS